MAKLPKAFAKANKLAFDNFEEFAAESEAAASFHFKEQRKRFGRREKGVVHATCQAWKDVSLQIVDCSTKEEFEDLLIARTKWNIRKTKFVPILTAILTAIIVEIVKYLIVWWLNRLTPTAS